MTVNGNSIARVDVIAVYDSVDVIQNSWQMRLITSALSEANALDDIVAILEALYTLMGTILSTLYVVQRIKAVNVTQDLDIGEGFFVDSTPGANSASFTAPQVCYGLNMITAKLGTFGRKFFGPVAENHITNTGVISSTALLELADVGDYVIANQTGPHGTWQFGVKSTVDSVWHPFTTYSIPLTATTQRRRRLGVGI